MMERKDHYDFCVVGAGPSGLTASREFLKNGSRTLLIERDDRVGGLAKSYSYDGQIFDTGPKRFHTEDQVVLGFLNEIVQQDMLRIPRSTEVHFLNRYFRWPLQPQDLWKLPPVVGLRAVLDLLRKGECGDPASFPDYIRSKYGGTLYRVFFEPYTRKFLRWDVAGIHSDWASTGIDRTVVDSRVRSNTAIDLIRSLLLPARINTEFLYPNHGGFGGFFDALFRVCQTYEGFRLCLGDSVARLRDVGPCLEVDNRQGGSFTCNHLVWTGNLNDLLALIGSDRRMPYLNTVFYNVVCKARDVRRKGAQWIYISDGNTLVSRITCMREFATYTCQPDYYNFICEMTDSQKNPEYFSQPERFIPRILREMGDVGFLRKGRDVEAIHINPVRDTYPIYFRGYQDEFTAAASEVARYSRRLRLLGRSGAFWYNNADHSIRFAIESARQLLGLRTAQFDYREYFGGSCVKAAHGTTV
jgi:protoporphyrinogen oxidase